MFRACALGLRKDIQKHYGITQHSRISVPLHVICYRVKITQRNYCTFRGRSPRIFRLFCRNVEKERSMIAPKSTPAHCIRNKKKEIISWNREVRKTHVTRLAPKKSVYLFVEKLYRNT